MLSAKTDIARALFLDAPIDLLTMHETIDIAMGAMRSQSKVTHVALNVAKFVAMRTDERLRADVLGADIIGVDGIGLALGARLLGIRVPERVSGIDLMGRILAECAENGFRPFFLGATRDVVEAAARAALRAYPPLEIAGTVDGYFSHDKIPDIVGAINESGADCLFVGMPTPRKEQFLAAHRHEINAPFVMGVGGSFDVMAGKVIRAPHWIQNAGFEWLFRTAQEPGRLTWRYANTNTRFLFILFKELLGLSPIFRKNMGQP